MNTKQLNLYLKSGGHHKVFLLETQFFAFEEVIVGVQDTRDVLGKVTIQDGLDVITVIDLKFAKNKI